jgi:hypothetical protein
MPRYHFHVADGRDYPDLQGTVLSDLAEVRIEAVRFAGQLLNDEAAQFWEGEDWSMRVTDNAGDTLFTLTFSATEPGADQ